MREQSIRILVFDNTIIQPNVRSRRTIMAETNGADAGAKKVVMITGGTGLVGCGIKEFVATDTEVSSFCSLTYNENRNQLSAGAEQSWLESSFWPFWSFEVREPKNSPKFPQHPG